MSDPRPIGVFDSGVGGLTVLRALREQLPQESFIYLGDTARLPYGTKSAETVVHYASQASELLIARDIKLLVVACNTASAYALEALQSTHPDLPVIGVIEPGARAAADVTAGNILVLATEGTIRSDAYGKAIARQRPGTQVTGIAATLLVALAEEGWHEDDVAAMTVRRYLSLCMKEDRLLADTILLGCTHFPLLRSAIARVAGGDTPIIDSAATTAADVKSYLMKHDLLNGAKRPDQFLVTDHPAKFARIAANFLGHALSEDDIECVALGAQKIRASRAA